MGADPCNEVLPSERAFSITEIFEKILLHLDLRSLLTSAQLVNRSWRQLIQESTVIQEALFFKPEKERGGDSDPILNPLLIETFPSFFPDDDGTSSFVNFKTLDMVQTPEKLAAYTRKEASWRKMLVQQAPISEFALLHLLHARGGDSLKRFRLDGNENPCDHDKTDIRMGTLFECVLLNPKISFSRFSSTRIGWSTTDFSLPGRGGSDGSKNDQEFEATMNHFRLVIYHRRTVQCSMGAEYAESEEMVVRRRITDAYVEH